MKFLLVTFCMLFVCVGNVAADNTSNINYVFNQSKVQRELESKEATFASVSALLSGINNSESETENMHKWFKSWLLKQETLNWNATKAVLEYGGFTAVDNDVFHRYFDISCFNGTGDVGWDKLVDYVTPYFDDKFHFSLSVKLAKINDRDKTICVLGKLAKYINYADLGIYKENAAMYEATNVTDVFNELDNEIKKINN